MRYLILSLVVILFTTIPASAGELDKVTDHLMNPDPWSTQDIVLEVAAQSLILMDGIQTYEIASKPDEYREIGAFRSILGEHPDKGEVVALFGASMAAHAVITHFLPKKARPYWQSFNIVWWGTSVANNFSIGLSGEF